VAANVDNLTKTYALANQLLREFGLAEQGWTFDFSQHKKILGQCDFDAKQILHSIYYLHNDPAEIEDTLRHEIAHALAGPGEDHGPLWKAWAVRCGAKPIRCAPKEIKSSARYNYVIKCTACGEVTSYKHRLRPALINRYISKCCGAKLQAYHAVYK
jgi:predicted SprT family Zn-dependent metalloprotease